MFISELFDNVPAPYRDEKSDNSAKKMGELRSIRLTLAQIKKLRMMNDLRKYEEEQKVTSLSKQYKPAAAAGAVPGL